MAKPNLTSEQRLKVYRLLFLLNRSFHFIVCRLSEAQTLDFITKGDAKDLSGMTQEIQIEINLAILDHLRHCEDLDFSQFGMVREAMEKTLKG